VELRTFLLVLAAASASFGQTLTVSSATAERGKPVDVDLTFAGGTPASATALEWVVSYPNELTLLATGPAAGMVLQAAGKSLTCRGNWKKAPSIYSYHCVLAGGRTTVPDGVVATLHFQVKPSVKGGVRNVDLDDFSAVTVDAKKVQVKKASGKLTITDAK